MTETNQPSQTNSVSAKQAYLRNNIPADKYEDFGEFCESIAGNVNIDEWNIDYVQELVDRFNRQ